MQRYINATRLADIRQRSSIEVLVASLCKVLQLADLPVMKPARTTQHALCHIHGLPLEKEISLVPLFPATLFCV
jgi:hypothetical protein